jgi:hypothetical protein
MSYTLTNEEKVGIIEQHLKTLEYNKYNLRVTMLTLSADPNSKAQNIKDLERQIETITQKQDVLFKELDSLNGEDNG